MSKTSFIFEIFQEKKEVNCSKKCQFLYEWTSFDSRTGNYSVWNESKVLSGAPVLSLMLIWPLLLFRAQNRWAKQVLSLKYFKKRERSTAVRSVNFRMNRLALIQELVTAVSGMKARFCHEHLYCLLCLFGPFLCPVPKTGERNKFNL